VSIDSTKSRGRKKKHRTATVTRAPKSTIKRVAPTVEARELSERAWLIAAISIMVVAAFLRLYHLELVPLHHDEGVNGNFLVRLVREGVYNYDPKNYHGPTLYYFSAIIPWTMRFLSSVHILDQSAQNTYGLTTFNIRLVTSLFGVATIWLVLLLRRRLGSIGSLSAAALLAVSPGAVYLSRYFIHESLFVFFTLGLVVASLRYWEERQPVYLILAAASAALLFATKETFIITAPVLLIAVVSTHLYPWLKKSRSARRKDPLTERLRQAVDRLGGPANLAMWSLVAVAVFVAVSVLFYSSFFKNWPQGVYDSLRTFLVWTKTGQEQHAKDWWTYIIKWLPKQESPVFLLGIIGAAIVVWKPANAFALFSALWAFGLIAAYSYVPYKTPWLMLNFLVPLALIGGYAIEWIYQELGDLRLMMTIGVVAVCINLYQSIGLNFFHYDNNDDYYVYVYVHTQRETVKLVDEIARIAKGIGKGKESDVGITIVAPEYWPLPWYFRDYNHVGYYGQMATSGEPMIIAADTVKQRTEMQERFGSNYQQVPSGLNPEGNFRLRPGVDLLLYVRRDLVGP
jgi:uncharacterized protein (TIGR03663 family)